MAIIQMCPVPTSAAKPTDDDIASLFCVSDGIPALEKRGEDTSRHTSIHIQGKMNMPVWNSSLVSDGLRGVTYKVLYLISS